MQVKKKVVILGAGFGGLTAAKILGCDSQLDVTVIDRHNYHLFQPLLYQVATAGLSPTNIAAPIRGILKYYRNITVLMDEVQQIDVQNRSVITTESKTPFDYLIVATGARHSYFGNEGWEKIAPGLKSIDDATLIRRKILLAFERAEVEHDPKVRQSLLTFVIVGGGPTGVELAGAISELANHALTSDFRNIEPKSARIYVVEAGDRILTSFPKELSQKAEKSLNNMGVEVLKNSRVEGVNSDGVRIVGKQDWLSAKTVIWAAGVKASKVASWLTELNPQTDRNGRVTVNADLSVGESSNIFVIGDAALALDDQGNPLPGVAPAAIQEGSYVAKRIKKLVRGKTDSSSFHYVNKGNLATIGRSSAVADFGKLRLSGFIAWVVWGVVHILYLISFRNRLLVLFEWFWAYVTFQKGSRLITKNSNYS
ncbi:MAG: NAD(P)/FAD-dependent oxidoreductase [Bacteriovoracia bacterium]